MVDLKTTTTFISVVLILFLVPGPAVMLVLTRTMQGGRRVGVFTGLGIAIGDFAHAIFAAVGLSALLMKFAVAFEVVKFAGAAYLVYLGTRALLEKSPKATLANALVIAPSKALFQAIPAEVLNPKTALFFLAFLPQFVHPERGSVLQQFATLGLIFVLLSAAYTTSLVLLTHPLGRVARRASWIKRWQRKAGGAILIGLGLRVAFQRR